MIGIEWNALTYAGHKVWNVCNETIEGKYKEGVKRKPRKEWMITENTHPPLITEENTEVILTNLENSTIAQSVAAARRGLSNYLLPGVLVSPDSRKWEGQQQKAYRLKANKNSTTEDPTRDLRKKLSLLDRDIPKAMDVALKLPNPSPALRKIKELEKTRESTANEITRLEPEYASHHSLKNLTEEQMHFIIDGLAEDLQGKEKSKLKELIASLVDKIILDPLTVECCIHYPIVVDDSLVMASPRGFEPLLPP